MDKLKRLLNEIIYIFSNYFVNNIPLWCVRKLLYQLLGMKIGKDSRILMRTIVELPWRIVIGSNTVINEMCLLDGRGGLTIGSNTTIATRTQILTGFHDVNSKTFEYRSLPVVIGNDVAIFANCTVLPGANIDDGCVFAAASVVTKGNYSKKTIFAGNPAKRLKERAIDDSYLPGKLGNWFR